MYGKAEPLGRREFFRWAGGRGIVLGLAATSLPAFLEACAREERKPVTTKPKEAEEGRAIVKDVLDFALASDEWEGKFGFVTIRLNKGTFDGKDVYFIQTDVSDQAFAEEEGLVFAHKIGSLAGAGLTGAAYLVSGGASGQATVLSTEPGRRDYTPRGGCTELLGRRLRVFSDRSAKSSQQEPEATSRSSRPTSS